ncbi:hypothetical protein [Burkholderia ambifaria]|nr:hypothetical protein [Burkholderia ambifaria]
MKAFLIFALQSLAALIVVVLVLAATQQWDESERCASTYCT